MTTRSHILVAQAPPHRRALSAHVRLLLPSLMLITSVAAQAESDVKIDTTRTTLEKWVETRQVIAKEKADWKLGREMLNDRIQIVQREITTLRERISEAERSVAEADKKRAELQRDNDALKQTATTLTTTVATLEGRTKDLLQRLPDPLRDRVKPLSQRLPDKPDETKLSLAERFQNVVGVLNEVNKFQREITLTSEVRSLPDGTATEVTTLYVGIGQGYYVSANQQHAGIGMPSATGWTWQPANNAAAAIHNAIAIAKGEQVAAFVPLPLRIQ